MLREHRAAAPKKIFKKKLKKKNIFFSAVAITRDPFVDKRSHGFESVSLLGSLS